MIYTIENNVISISAGISTLEDIKDRIYVLENIYNALEKDKEVEAEVIITPENILVKAPKFVKLWNSYEPKDMLDFANTPAYAETHLHKFLKSKSEEIEKVNVDYTVSHEGFKRETETVSFYINWDGMLNINSPKALIERYSVLSEILALNDKHLFNNVFSHNQIVVNTTALDGVELGCIKK